MKIQVHHPRRRSVSGPMGNVVISCDDSKLEIDEGNMAPRLKKLIPYPTGQASEEDWKPFCVLAIAMGLL